MHPLERQHWRMHNQCQTAQWAESITPRTFGHGDVCRAGMWHHSQACCMCMPTSVPAHAPHMRKYTWSACSCPAHA